MELLPKIRWLILAVLVFGMVGTLVELLLLAHYEDLAQFVPLMLIGVALAIIGWHLLRPSAGKVVALRIVMILFTLAGFAGVVFHYAGAAEFQRELDPTQRFWEVFKKVARVQAPPLLAPGVMLQLGLLGLIYTYQHPVRGPHTRCR